MSVCCEDSTAFDLMANLDALIAIKGTAGRPHDQQDVQYLKIIRGRTR
jgi:hypothetical protein